MPPPSWGRGEGGGVSFRGRGGGGVGFDRGNGGGGVGFDRGRGGNVRTGFDRKPWEEKGSGSQRGRGGW